MFAIIDANKTVINVIELDEKEATAYGKHLPKGQTLVPSKNARIGDLYNGTNFAAPKKTISLEQSYFEATVKSMTFTHITKTAKLTVQANMAAYLTELSFAERLSAEQKKEVDTYRAFNAWVANVRKAAKQYISNTDPTKLATDWHTGLVLPEPSSDIVAFASRF